MDHGGGRGRSGRLCRVHHSGPGVLAHGVGREGGVAALGTTRVGRPALRRQKESRRREVEGLVVRMDPRAGLVEADRGGPMVAGRRDERPGAVEDHGEVPGAAEDHDERPVAAEDRGVRPVAAMEVADRDVHRGGHDAEKGRMESCPSLRSIGRCRARWLDRCEVGSRMGSVVARSWLPSPRRERFGCSIALMACLF